MAKGKTTVFFCQNCGHESAKWMGQCPGCRQWNTFVEETIEKQVSEGYKKKGQPQVRSAFLLLIRQKKNG